MYTTYEEYYKRIVNFIREVYGGKDFIHLHAPYLDEEDKKRVLDSIEEGYVSYISSTVELFEESIKKYTGAKYCVATVNGTSALHISLLCLGVSEGDEVVTQPVTFVATCNAISYCGANPVFVDISKETLGMCPDSLYTFLKKYTFLDNAGNLINKETGRKIKACLPVYIFGHPPEMDAITEICKEFNIPVVEDSAQALGTWYKGKHAGLWGDVGIISFNGNKIITTGGGGCIITNREDIYKKAAHLVATAKIDHPFEYMHDTVGYNYRMPGLNASLGLSQMSKLKKILDVKRKLASKYCEFFKEINYLEFVNEPQNSYSNYWLNSIIFPSEELRTKFIKFCLDSGVQVRPLWRLMYKLPMYSECFKLNTPVAENFEGRVVSIPSGVVPQWMK